MESGQQDTARAFWRPPQCDFDITVPHLVKPSSAWPHGNSGRHSDSVSAWCRRAAPVWGVVLSADCPSAPLPSLGPSYADQMAPPGPAGFSRRSPAATVPPAAGCPVSAPHSSGTATQRLSRLSPAQPRYRHPPTALSWPRKAPAPQP